MLEGIEDAFRRAKIVLLTTYSPSGEERTRPMTNVNESPYAMIIFPTDRDTRKVADIEKNSKVLITFPGEVQGSYYEIEGEAHLAEPQEVRESWFWWYIYWHPHLGERYSTPQEGFWERKAVIHVKPLEARKGTGDKAERVKRELKF